MESPGWGRVTAVRRETFTLLSLLALGCRPANEPPLVAPSAPPPVTTVTPAPLPSGPTPPVATREPQVTEIHGQKRTDDYAWLRKKDSPEVVSYLQAENAYTEGVMNPTAALQEKLYQELLGHVKQDDATPPYKDGAFVYYRRFETGKQYPIYCRKSATPPKGKDAPEEVTLDLNAIGKGEKFIDVIDMEVSDDGSLLAYLVDTVGFRQYTLQVKDLRTGKLGPEAIPRVDRVVWAKDGKTLLYVTEDATTKRSNKIFRHVLGADAAADPLVVEEKDEMFDLHIDRTRDKALFVATSSSKMTSEVRVLDADRPTGAFKLVAPREHGHEYYVDHRKDVLYIRENGKGRNFRVVTVKTSDPRPENWKEIVPHRDDVMIEGVDLFRDFMVLDERKNALPLIAITDLATGRTRELPAPEPVFEERADVNREWDAQRYRLRFESPRTPLTWVEEDMSKDLRTVLKRTEVPNFDPALYETMRINAPARDGTAIPVSLVFKKGTQPDGTHPAFLYAYGSYGFTARTSFSSDRLALLDRGFVYAHAHIRGGGDMGKRWHEEGRMMNKLNTFTDFIDVAEHLKNLGYAKPDALVVEGRSAGGLLMGAVTNMRPDLFRIVLAEVPFVDVINTMLDESLPLTVGEFEEWGNPKERPAYDYMMRYSPYDNVAAKAYQTMLVRTSYNDSQVMYWEPAKWVARLRANKTDTNHLLFKVNMDPAGHGGQSGRYDRMHDTAFDDAFLLTELGLGGR
jgi:oligopeptidase B